MRTDLLARRIHEALNLDRERCLARLLGDTDFDQRRAYSVVSDPGDISGALRSFDSGAAQAADDDD